MLSTLACALTSGTLRLMRATRAGGEAMRQLKHRWLVCEVRQTPCWASHWAAIVYSSGRFNAAVAGIERSSALPFIAMSQ